MEHSNSGLALIGATLGGLFYIAVVGGIGLVAVSLCIALISATGGLALVPMGFFAWKYFGKKSSSA